MVSSCLLIAQSSGKAYLFYFCLKNVVRGNIAGFLRGYWTTTRRRGRTWGSASANCSTSCSSTWARTPLSTTVSTTGNVQSRGFSISGPESETHYAALWNELLKLFLIFRSGVDSGCLSRIRFFFISDPGSKFFSISDPLQRISLGNIIRVVHPGSRSGSWFYTHPGSRIQGSKRHRIPGSATLIFDFFVLLVFQVFESQRCFVTMIKKFIRDKKNNFWQWFYLLFVQNSCEI